MKPESLYAACVAAGIPTANHESDLYIPANEQAAALIKQFGLLGSTFENQVEGGMWYDVPFAYDPWWEVKAKV